MSTHSTRMIQSVQLAAEHLLNIDGANKPEHDIELDVCIEIGEREGACSRNSRDYAPIMSFLRKMVSSGNIEVVELEQVLETLNELQQESGRMAWLATHMGHARVRASPADTIA
eukprot:scpid104286/ scgid31279/ 